MFLLCCTSDQKGGTNGQGEWRVGGWRQHTAEREKCFLEFGLCQLIDLFQYFP